MKQRIFRSGLRNKIIFFIIVPGTIVAVTFTSVAIYIVFSSVLQDNLQKDMARSLETIYQYNKIERGAQTESTDTSPAPTKLKQLFNKLSADNQYFYFGLDASGKPIAPEVHKVKSWLGTKQMEAIVEQKSGSQRYTLAQHDGTLLASYRHWPERDVYIGIVANEDQFISQALVKATQYTLLLLVFFTIAGVLAGVFVLRFITVRLSMLQGILQEMTESMNFKDFSQKISPIAGKHDELGSLASDFETFTKILREILINVQNTGELLNEASQELISTSRSLGGEMESENKKITEVNQRIQEINSEIQAIADFSDKQSQNTDKMTKLMEGLSQAGDRVKKMVQEFSNVLNSTSQEITTANETIDETKSAMNSMLDSSGRINEVIGIINDISDQINLLSLNAAIEAARAGDSGRGFAVVADEIAKLADQTASSTKEIESLVRGVSSEVSEGVNHVEHMATVLGKIVNSIQSISKQSQEIKEIVQKQSSETNDTLQEVEGLREMSSQVTEATNKQNQNVSSIASAINEIETRVQNTAHTAGTVEESANGIGVQANNLKRLREQFHVELDEKEPCPNLLNCPIYDQHKMDASSYHYIDTYCRGDYDNCARKIKKDNGEEVPLALLPDGSMAEQ